MGAQRELVDEHLRGEEQLDCQQARDVDAVGEADGPPSGLVGALGREGDGASTSWQIASCWRVSMTG